MAVQALPLIIRFLWVGAAIFGVTFLNL